MEAHLSHDEVKNMLTLVSNEHVRHMNKAVESGNMIAAELHKQRVDRYENMLDEVEKDSKDKLYFISICG